MWSRLLHIVAALSLVTLQLSWAIWLDHWTPSFALAVLLALSLAGDVRDSLWWVVLGGLGLDFMSGQLIGLHLILFAGLSLGLLSMSRQVLYQSNPILVLPVFALFAFIYELLIGLAVHQLTWVIFPLSVITAILSGLVYYLIRRVSVGKEVIHLG